MGTASSKGGPSDKPPLLPSWAMPFDDAAADSATDNEDQPSDSSETPSEVSPNTQTSAPAAPTRTRGPWQIAKASLTAASRSGSGRGRMVAAGRAYVRAKGGSSGAAKSATAGRKSVSRVGSFLGTLARSGLAEALKSINLASYVGRTAEEVFAAMANVLMPEGALVEDAAARAAVDQALATLYDKVSENGGDLGVLDSLTETDVAAAIEECVFLRTLGR